MAINLFGFEILRKKSEVQLQPQVATPVNDDGALTVTAGGYFGTYLDLEASFKNENDLISRYREMAMQPELEAAIDDVVNEAIVHDVTGKSVTIVLDDLEQPEKIKDMIREEFNNVLRMLDFSNSGQDIFRQWYIDGRVFYQVLIDEKQPRLGIQELVYIDPRKIKKVRSVVKKKDSRTGIEVVQGVQEFYVFNEKATTQGQNMVSSAADAGVKIATDAIVNVNSGLMDAKRQLVLSYLHKAIKPLNQLRMVEDAVVIYRLSRAPERRVFYIDVGNLPKGKAEQYLRDVMIKYKNKIVYDAATGEVRDDRKHMSMLEDFWLPRREGGKGTEITTLAAGQNLGELADVVYFRQKLLNALNVPISRLEPQQGGMIGLGRTTEVTRDEVKFAKFVARLRNKFSQIFDYALRTQLSLKGICSVEEWDNFKEDIYYEFKKDNNFTEMREAELLKERMSVLQLVDPYIGKYYSLNWVKQNILQFTEEEIEKMDEEMKDEENKGIGGPTFPADAQGQGQQEPEATAEQYPAEDNTQEADSTESLTPMLDKQVEKYSSGLNKR